MRKRIVLVVPSYNGASRLEQFILSVYKYDMFTTPVLVYEDYSGILGVSQLYDSLAAKYRVSVVHSVKWRNMHGAAMDAFDHAINNMGAEWVIYLGDDVLVTPGALSNMVHFLANNELKTVGLVQFPYWNAHDLIGQFQPGFNDFEGPALLSCKEDMYTKPLDWLERVPRNKHWDGDGFARPYINVNGAGFACHAPTYTQVGGFAEGTWCLDESLSLRVWTDSRRGVVALPGPPLVHYFGAAQDTPPHDLNTEQRWIEATGMTKQQSGELSSSILTKRSPAIIEEMRQASYWRI